MKLENLQEYLKNDKILLIAGISLVFIYILARILFIIGVVIILSLGLKKYFEYDRKKRKV